MNFIDANDVAPIGKERLKHRSNYFFGNDSSKWTTNVPNCQEIIYNNIYNDIDLRYYSTPAGLKYDFIVHPGGDPRAIRLQYEGAKGIKLDPKGNLNIVTKFGNIIDSRPTIYQKFDDSINDINGDFRILSKFSYGFNITDDYDREQDLIIDPLIYSTYLGSSGDEYCGGIDIDNFGSAYVIGRTNKNTFPITTGAYDTSFNGDEDAFVVKLNSNGSGLVYSTFIGGSLKDRCEDIKVNNNGSAIVIGGTYSSNFPTTQNSYDRTLNGGHDIFVFKLNPTGSKLNFSTYIGGSQSDAAVGLCIDPIGISYICGVSYSTNFPTTIDAFNTSNSGGSDFIVFKLNSTGTGLLYSTYIGGSSNGLARDISIDLEGNIYLVGNTRSNDFPVTIGANDTTYNGGNDGIILKLNSTGQTLDFCSYIGGSGDDIFWGMTTDKSGNVYATGYTYDSDFPITANSFDEEFNGFIDGIVVKLNNNGSDLVFSTFIGGTNYDEGSEILLDSEGNIYLGGRTGSFDFPVIPKAYDTKFHGKRDVIIVKLSSDGDFIINSTFLGGDDSDGCYGMAIDKNDTVYISGLTCSSNFPTTSGAYDTSYNSDKYDDVFISKLNFSDNQTLKGSPPKVIDLSISNSTMYRNNTITVFSNGNDLEDIEKNLTPTYQYRDPNNKFWNTTYFNNLSYKNSTWEVEFTPQKNAIVGKYDFRVYFNDTNKLDSPYFYLIDSLDVLNYIPTIIDFKLSKNKSGGNSNLYLWSNGTDNEQPESELTIEIEYRDPNEQSWNISYINKSYYKNNKWVTIFTLPLRAPFGYYDFRARFIDSEMGSNKNLSKWLYSNDSLFIYNAPPEVKDLKLSKTGEFQNKAVFIWVNGSDSYDYEKDLVIEIEYRDPNKQSWNTSYLSSPIYKNNRWEIKIIVPFGTILGSYDFRIRFFDSNLDSSGWFYANNSLLIHNQIPVLIDLKLSKNIIYRPENIDIYLNASDYETPEQSISVYGQFKHSIDSVWQDLILSYSDQKSRWESIFETTIFSSTGQYDLRFRLEDSDKQISSWYYNNKTINVQNNQPIVQNLLLSTNITLVDEQLTVWVVGSDVEDNIRYLKFDLEYKPPFDIEWTSQHLSTPEYYGDKWGFELDLPMDAKFGYYDLRVNVRDLDNNESGWVVYEDILLVKNRSPQILDTMFLPDKIYRGQSTRISIYSTDHETPNNLLTLYSQYKHKTDSNWKDLPLGTITQYNSYEDCWQIEFTAENDFKIGYYDFRFQNKDHGDITGGRVYFNSSLEVINRLPVIDDIEPTTTETYRGETIIISVLCSDHEDENSLLAVELEYKGFFDTQWTTTGLEGPTYDIDNWVYYFSIPADHPVTTLDFRARAKDNDLGQSDWYYSYDMVNVMNRPPTIVDIAVSKNTVLRTDSLFITMRAKDQENSANELKLNSQYRAPGASKWLEAANKLENDRWNIDFYTDINSIIGYYDLRFQVVDADGDASAWLYMNSSFEVVNDLPVISDELQFINVGINEFDLNMIQFGTDLEDQPDELMWRINYFTVDFELIQYILIDNKLGKLSITPQEDVKGTDEIGIILTDKDGGWVEKTDIIIYVDSKIEIGSIKPVYQVSLEIMPGKLDLSRGKAAEVNLIVTNMGNMKSSYNIKCGDLELIDYVDIEQKTIILEPGGTGVVSVIVTAPRRDLGKTVDFTFIAKNDKTITQENLTVNIKPDEGSARDLASDDYGSMFIVLIAVIIILIVLVIILFMLFIRERGARSGKAEKTKNFKGV